MNTLDRPCRYRPDRPGVPGGECADALELAAGSGPGAGEAAPPGAVPPQDQRLNGSFTRDPDGPGVTGRGRADAGQAASNARRRAGHPGPSAAVPLQSKGLAANTFPAVADCPGVASGTRGDRTEHGRG